MLIYILYMYINMYVNITYIHITGGGHISPLHDFCLESLKDRGAWSATACRITKYWT